MWQKTERKSYVKPKVVSEKVFEQAALACSRSEFDARAMSHMKVNSHVCGWHSS